MAQEWREVPGYEGFYEISDNGQVRSEYSRGLGSHRSLGAKYGVSRTTIAALLTGRTWSWLPDNHRKVA